MFKLPEEVVKTTEKFSKALTEFLEGRMNADRFKGVRVPWGIYSQRGGRAFMARIRIPAGVVTPQQLKALGECSLNYGDGVLHVTIRQDIQIHGVRIEDVGKIISYLKDFQLSPRGGGGNTVRNVTACPLAGICPKERFDVRGHAIALTEFLLQDINSYRLPRKYKIAFSGCERDCALATVTDLGFIAKRVDSVEGFSVYVGGGLGAKSMVGQLLEEFVSSKDIAYVAEAVKRVFFKYGERRDRHHARLRFLVERLGVEGFRNLYRKELEGLKRTTHIALRDICLRYPPDVEDDISVAGDSQFEAFKKYNVFSQKQGGYFAIGIRLPLGDIPAEDLIRLADIGERFSISEFRTSQAQNIYLCNVRADMVYPIYSELKAAGLARLYIDTILDPIVCRGATTCNLGLCNSKGLAEELVSNLEAADIDLDTLQGMTIKISGCPNACGHHPTGTIGLHGIVRRVGARPVPFYKILLGGKVMEGGTRLAEEVGLVPARNVPAVLKTFLTRLQGSLERYEGNVHDYLTHEGKHIMEKVLEEHSYVPPYEEDPSFYRDFGQEEDFSLVGRGPGECGAGILDMIEADLEEARAKLSLAEEKAHDTGLLKEILYLSARALLVVKGIDPKSPEEALEAFYREFIESGIVSPRFRDLKARFTTLRGGMGDFEYARALYEEVRSLYASMDSNFQFPTRERATEEVGALDLRGTPCPMNYVKAKLFLETLPTGSVVDILLDGGEPIANVPGSLEKDGHEIMAIEDLGGFYMVKVRKGMMEVKGDQNAT